MSRELIQTEQELLDFMGGGKYTINVGNGFFDSHKVEFDTSLPRARKSLERCAKG